MYAPGTLLTDWVTNSLSMPQVLVTVMHQRPNERPEVPEAQGGCVGSPAESHLMPGHCCFACGAGRRPSEAKRWPQGVETKARRKSVRGSSLQGPQTLHCLCNKINTCSLRDRPPKCRRKACRRASSTALRSTETSAFLGVGEEELERPCSGAGPVGQVTKPHKPGHDSGLQVKGMWPLFYTSAYSSYCLQAQ